MILDDEKIPTTPFEVVIVRRVKIESRYQKLHELTKMGELVRDMEARDVARIASIWCNSNQGSDYEVTMREGFDTPDVTKPMARRIGAILQWYNFIKVGSDGYMNPNWPEDEVFIDPS